VEQLSGAFWVHRVEAEGFPTVGAVALTATRVFVVDTLLGLRDMEPAKALVRERGGERRVVVVNTHHHWDHVYGNAAFPGADIVAHRTCPRLITAHITGADESVPIPPPEGVPLPTVTFGDRVSFADDDETVHLIHTPGHSEDSIVAFLPRARLLFAGDTVEWPLPNLAWRGGLEQWVRTLRQLKQLPADLIVPSHGPAMGKEIVDANERYLLGLAAAVAEARERGVPRGELEVPPAGLLPEGAAVDAVYEAAHHENVLRAWDEV
jgi:glyoxylase-like metal-dependent hydrolase (beta-lactamase superfamily II)